MTNLKDEKGPFDIIGDVHGCFDELCELLKKLGHENHGKFHPEGRKLLFLGDLVDRGPKTPDVLRLVMGIVKEGKGFCVRGNHDDKLRRKLQGRDVKIAHGLDESLKQLDPGSQEFKEEIIDFLDKLAYYYELDDGKLVIAHAGIKEKDIGHDSPRVRAFCMYGETTGKLDESGLPIRYPWADEYSGLALIAYGHTPVGKIKWVNNTINIDTGCVFGGKLTALRYPEKTFVEVKSFKTYCLPLKPFEHDYKSEF